MSTNTRRAERYRINAIHAYELKRNGYSLREIAERLNKDVTQVRSLVELGERIKSISN